MASEKRLIDANDVYKLFDKNGMARIHVGDIDTIPRVDAVEVVHGHWYWKPSGEKQWTLTCSVCESQDGTSESYNYCPNCGAKMDGERKDNERKAD